MRRYQEHAPGVDATSNSHHKLTRLKIPKNMAGKSYLDIGCSEGFFCNVAAERGASRVVGIDVKTPSLEVARELYARDGVEFREQSWKTLPEGKFDVILLSSALHYEADPGDLLNRIADALAPGGMFILELGVAPEPTREMVLVQRRRRATWMPTERYLLDTLLRRFACRRVSKPELVTGDPTPRSVYHCRLRLTTVLMFRGRSHDGKSTAAKLFGGGAAKFISVDKFILRLLVAQFQHTPFEAFMAANRSRKLANTYLDIDAQGWTEDFTTLLSQAILPSDDSVVIEGFLTDAQTLSLGDKLAGRAIVWDAARVPTLVPDDVASVIEDDASEEDAADPDEPAAPPMRGKQRRRLFAERSEGGEETD